MPSPETEIMVVKNNILFDSGERFQGLSHNEINYENIILRNYEWMRCKLAEENFEYKQPISYISIINPKIKKVFLYQRSIDPKKYSEKRLQGKLSIGVGGHIEKKDFKTGGNYIRESMLRELVEEVDGLEPCLSEKVLGYINYDGDEVSKVHFGILYMLPTFSENIKPKDPEIKEGGLKSLEEVEDLFNSEKFIVEAWSKIALDKIKEFLE